MNTFWLAIALVLVVEGIGPLLFPNRWKAYMRKVSDQPIAQIRQIGLTLVSLGLIIWIFVR